MLQLCLSFISKEVIFVYIFLVSLKLKEQHFRKYLIAIFLQVEFMIFLILFDSKSSVAMRHIFSSIDVSNRGLL